MNVVLTPDRSNTPAIIPEWCTAKLLRYLGGPDAGPDILAPGGKWEVNYTHDLDDTAVVMLSKPHWNNGRSLLVLRFFKVGEVVECSADATFKVEANP